jgi:AcrR family transcriptional regulator
MAVDAKRRPVTDIAQTKRRSPGRPPDPEIESRVFHAARELYAETGWAGFSIHLVASRARVGKTAIYRRWASKEELIVDAIVSMAPAELEDRGSLREDLVSAVEAELRGYLSQAGIVRLRAQIEAKVYPELFGRAMERFRRLRLDGGKRIIAAAVERGELADDHDGLQLLDAVGGITVNRFLATPSHALSALERNSRQFAESTVDYAMRAVQTKNAKRTK